MSRIPDDIESKYNKDEKFIWVDGQWEKYMDKQKELEDRMLKLEIENAELRDRLIELGEDVKSTPNDMELGGKVRHKNWKWIYESPDGGKTVYRRKFGDYETSRELVKDRDQMDLFPLKA